MSMIIKTLGNFTCTAQLGKGGMGEVYQAKDQKLGRDVAIKVLPEEFAKDADRVARFQREAKLLASLNHPNIAAIYGLEESGGIHFLVLELIEGDTLADRLKRGAVPVEEALKLALQIAEALEAAHEKGVIHRDLKPANIKVTPDGKVKVLDFGLAKAFAGDQGDINLSNSPTLSAAATQQGIILGTAAYMSPEQARGKPVDKGTDIWAFGCVLCEMLTGRPAFSGRDVTEILAAVIRSEPDWKNLPANLHWRLKELLERCLEKEAGNRYSGISDARVDIQKILADPSGLFVQRDAVKEPGMGLRTILPWILAIIIVGTGVWFLKPKPPAEPRHTTRLYYELPEDQQLFLPYDSILAVSPDGRQFVYSTPGGLYLRSLNELEARLIPGTEGSPQRPFFSPDGEWIGYWSGVENQLKKIPISGGASVGLADVTGAGTYSWQRDGMIVFGQISGGLMRVSENGGTPELFLESEQEGLIHPQILLDGESILFTNIATQPYTIMVQSLKTGERRQLFPGDTARYLPTGHVIYSIGNNLFARRFNPDTLEVTGGQVPLVEGIFKMGGASQYAVSDSGTLIYIPGELPGGSLYVSQSTFVWVDRNGMEEPLAAPPNTYLTPRISPDGSRMAYAALDGENLDIWVWDLVRETPTRLTFDPEIDLIPLWTADSTKIVYLSLREGKPQVWLKAANGTGKPEPLGSFDQGVPFPSSWSDDGKTLIAMVLDDLNAILPSSSTISLNLDIGALSVEGDHKSRILLQEQHSESDATISPDGQWLAYTSNESGKNHVYVRPYPDMEGGRWQISTTGGEYPLWSPDGSELYYRNGDEVMAVSVTMEPTFNFQTAKTLFRKDYVSAGQRIVNLDINPWDIHPDGKRFLMMKPVETADREPTTAIPRKINIVLNWFEELKERVPRD